MNVNEIGKIFVFTEMTVKGKDYLVGKCHRSREEEAKDFGCGLGFERSRGMGRSRTCGDGGQQRKGAEWEGLESLGNSLHVEVICVHVLIARVCAGD